MAQTATLTGHGGHHSDRAAGAATASGGLRVGRWTSGLGPSDAQGAISAARTRLGRVCFGDRTIASLYASASPRGAVATAKILLLTAWAIAIAAGLGPVAVLIGIVTGLGPPDSPALLALGRVIVLAVLTGVLALMVTIFASVGRGYLAAFGALI